MPLQKLTSQQILTAVGPSAPVGIMLDAAFSPSTSYQPVLAVALSSDANLTAIVEAAFDDPDQNYNIPLTATWFPLQEWNETGSNPPMNGLIGAGASKTGVMGGAGYSPIYRNFSAVRVRITSYVAGSLTMIVRQVYLPNIHGA